MSRPLKHAKWDHIDTDAVSSSDVSIWDNERTPSEGLADAPATHFSDAAFKFPTEIWGEIFALLIVPPSSEQLANVAQVCKTFHAIVKSLAHLIFRDVDLTEACPPNSRTENRTRSPYPLRPRTRELMRSTAAQGFVQSLNLSCPCNNIPTCRFGATNFPGDLYAVIPTLIGLRHLKLSRIMLVDTELESFAALPNLTSLELVDAALPEGRHRAWRKHTDAYQMHLTSLKLARWGQVYHSDFIYLLSRMVSPALKTLTIVCSRPHDTAWLTTDLKELLLPNSLESLSLTHVCPDDDGSMSALLMRQASLRTLRCGVNIRNWSLPKSALPDLETVEAPGEMLRILVPGRPIESISIIPSIPRDDKLLESLKRSCATIQNLSFTVYTFDATALKNVIMQFPDLLSLSVVAEASVITEEFLDDIFAALTTLLPHCTYLHFSAYCATAFQPNTCASHEWQLGRLTQWGETLRDLNSVGLDLRKWIRVGFWDWAEDRGEMKDWKVC